MYCHLQLRKGMLQLLIFNSFDNQIYPCHSDLFLVDLVQKQPKKMPQNAANIWAPNLWMTLTALLLGVPSEQIHQRRDARGHTDLLSIFLSCFNFSLTNKNMSAFSINWRNSHIVSSRTFLGPGHSCWRNNSHSEHKTLPSTILPYSNNKFILFILL